MREDDISVVIPCYNEENTLEETISKVKSNLEKHSEDFEIIIVEDGCTDSTPEIADKIASESDKIKHLHFEERQGRGRAVHKAFKMAEDKKLVYMDADLATNVKSAEKLCRELDRYDIVTGSRYHEESTIERDFTRKIASLGYNKLVKTIIGSSVEDHQCGFKGITKECFEEISSTIESKHWFWDTEILLRAQRKGFKVKEIPIEWIRKDDSKVNLEEDVPNFAAKILWMKKEFIKQKVYN